MSELRAYLGLYARGDASQKVKELDKGIEQMATRGARHLGRLSRAASAMGQGLDSIGNRYTAVLSGAGGAGAVKMVSDLDTRMTYLGINAGKTTAEMDALKAKVFEAAQAPDIRMDPAQILDAIDVIVEKTGNLDLASDNIRNMGLVMRATQAAGKDVGGVVAQYYEKANIKVPEDMLGALDHMVNAAKAGAVSVAELATKGPQLASAYAVTGRVSKQATAEVDALVQMMIKGSGGIDQATTAFEAFMRTLNDGSKRKALTAKGIQIMDPEDPKRMRAGTEIIKDIITKAGGDMVKISAIFDSEAMRGLNPIIKEFNDTGGFKSMDGFLNVASDGKTILADASTAAKTFGASMQMLNTSWQKFADANLTEPVRAMAELMDRMDPDKVQAFMKAGAGVVGVVGGLVLARKAQLGYRGLKDMFGVGSAVGKTAAAGAAAGGPMPVMVVNWPAGGVGLGGGDKGFADTVRDALGDADSGDADSGGSGRRRRGQGARGLRGLASRAGRWLGRAGGGIGGVLGAVDVAGSLMDGDTRGALAGAGRTIGGLGGGALGSLLGPAGMIGGGAAGAWGGEKLFTALYDYFAADKKDAGAEVKGAIELTVKTEGGASARVTGLSSQTPGFEFDVGRMAGP